MRILASITLTILLVAPMSDAHGSNDWLGAGSDNLWSNPDNWSEGFPPPDATTHPNTGWDDPAGPFYPLTPDPSDDCPSFCNAAHLKLDGTTTLIDDSVTDATAYGLYVGRDGANNLLEMTGGNLTVGGWHLNLGRGFNKSGNPDAKATFRMSGGTFNTTLVKIPEQFVDNSLPDPGASAPLHGELIMTGGTFNTRIMKLGQLEGNGTAEFSGDAEINFLTSVTGDGGFFEYNDDWNVGGVQRPGTGDVNVDISENAVINIFGHIEMLRTTPDADEVARYQGHIDAGELTADNGTDVPTIYLGNDRIKICALDADFDSDCDADDDDWATWQANYGATGTPGDLKTMGDADNDGDVDGADLLELQIEYGAGVSDDPPPLSAVPEPTSLVLTLYCTIAVAGRRRRYVFI